MDSAHLAPAASPGAKVEVSGRKQLALPNLTDLAEPELKLLSFITEWNETAHPFEGTKASFETILAKLDNALQLAA